VKDAEAGVDVEMVSSPTEGLLTLSNVKVCALCLIYFVCNVLYRVRCKDVRETHRENFNSWTKRVASRTLENFEGHDAATEVKGNEQTGHCRLTAQTRAVPQAAIELIWSTYVIA
jgi:hypothetical protein